jgi:hypothetical protein
MLVSKGEYQAWGEGKWVKSHGTGRPGLLINWHVESEGPLKGKAFVAKPRYLSDQTRDRLEKSMRAMGWTGAKLSDLTGLGTKTCRITVTEDQDTVKRDGSPNEVEVAFVDAVRGAAPLGEYGEATADEIDAILSAPPKRSSSGAEMPDDGRFE